MLKFPNETYFSIVHEKNIQQFTKKNKDHFDLSENQDSCDNHPEESKYDENDDQVGGYRSERRGDRVVVDEVLQSSVLCTHDEVRLVNLNITIAYYKWGICIFYYYYALPKIILPLWIGWVSKS